MQAVGRWICVLATMALVLLPAGLRAEVRKGEFLFGPYGLYSLPLDDYPAPILEDVPFLDMGSEVEPHPGLSGAIDRIMGPNWSLGAEFKVYFAGVDEHLLQDFLDFHVPNLDGIEVTWRTVHFGARGRYYLQPEKSLNPFLQAGAGIYVTKFRAAFSQIRGSGSTNDYYRSESYTSPGVSFGPGMLFRVSKDTRISLDAVFTNIFTSERNVRYLGASLGIIFSVTPE